MALYGWVLAMRMPKSLWSELPVASFCNDCTIKCTHKLLWSAHCLKASDAVAPQAAGAFDAQVPAPPPTGDVCAARHDQRHLF